MTKKVTLEVPLPDGRVGTRTTSNAYDWACVGEAHQGDGVWEWAALSFHSGRDMARKGADRLRKAPHAFRNIEIKPVHNPLVHDALPTETVAEATGTCGHEGCFADVGGEREFCADHTPVTVENEISLPLSLTLARGDLVWVAGEGRVPFTFLAHKVGPTGEEWVDVWGPVVNPAGRRLDERSPHGCVRSFNPSLLSKEDKMADSKKKGSTGRKIKAEKVVSECLCGCGGSTGGRFVPGHDAKMKGRLIGEIRDARKAGRSDAKPVSTLHSMGWGKYVPDAEADKARDAKRAEGLEKLKAKRESTKATPAAKAKANGKAPKATKPAPKGAKSKGPKALADLLPV